MIQTLVTNLRDAGLTGQIHAWREWVSVSPEVNPSDPDCSIIDYHIVLRDRTDITQEIPYCGPMVFPFGQRPPPE